MYIDEDGIYCIGKEKKLKITRELIDKLYNNYPVLYIYLMNL